MNMSPVRCLCLLAALGVSPLGAFAQSGKPNIPVIVTDDVGVWNISAHHRGMMGGSTPNIDRIANEGALFTGSIRTANVPIVVNLRQDPFERYPFESALYRRWQAEKLWALMPAQAIVATFLQSFREFPPSQKSGSFTVEQLLQQLQAGATGAGN